MDRVLSLTLFVLALACLCAAALLALSGFIDWLIHGRWPDQSLLRLGYDTGLLESRWFLAAGWTGPVREMLAWLPGSLVTLALAPLCWRLSNRLEGR